MDCRKESSTLNSNAHQILRTAKPSIKKSANSMIIAFMINKNNPSVIKVIGKVNTTKIGFTNSLRIANTIATIIAEQYFQEPIDVFKFYLKI